MGWTNLWSHLLQLIDEKYSEASYADRVMVREMLQSPLPDKPELQQGRSGKHFVSVRCVRVTVFKGSCKQAKQLSGKKHGGT